MRNSNASKCCIPVTRFERAAVNCSKEHDDVYAYMLLRINVGLSREDSNKFIDRLAIEEMDTNLLVAAFAADMTVDELIGAIHEIVDKYGHLGDATVTATNAYLTRRAGLPHEAVTT